jgi:hypothetical protein
MKKIMKKDSVIHRTQTISGFKSNGRITQFNRLYLPQGLSGTNTVSKPRDVEANAGSARKTSILSSMRRYSRRGPYSDESDSSHHYRSSESERSIFGMMIAGVVTSPTIISRKLCNLRYTKNVKITVRGDLGAAFTAIDEDRQVSSVLSE